MLEYILAYTIFFAAFLLFGCMALITIIDKDQY